MCVVDQVAYLVDLYMNQLEWMAAETLVNAGYEVAYYEGNEVVETVPLSFGRHADLVYDRTGNDQWSNDASNPVEDLREGMDRMAQHAGAVSEPDVICGWRAFGDLIAHPDVKVDLDSRHLTDIMIAAGAGKMQGLHPAGQIAGFPIYVHHDFYEDDAGVLQRYIPTDSVHLVSIQEYLGTLARGSIRGLALRRRDADGRIRRP